GGLRWGYVRRELVRFVAGHRRRGGGYARRRRRGAHLPPHDGRGAVLPVETAIDPELFHASRIGVEDFEFERPGPWHELAAHGHAADPRRHISGEGVHFLGDVAHIEFTDDCRDVLEARAGVGEKRAVGLAHHAWRHVLVVFVRDLADDLLDDVLDRYDPVGAALFIPPQAHMDARRLPLGHQL